MFERLCPKETSETRKKRTIAEQFAAILKIPELPVNFKRKYSDGRQSLGLTEFPILIG